MKATGLLLLFLFTPAILFGQKYHFDKLGLENGLSQISVLSLHQDHLNRIWIGTIDGLNCYDGVYMKVYRQKKADANSLLGHNVKEIIQEGNSLWILTGSGISELNLLNLNFKRYPIKDALSLSSYRGTILVGTRRGLYYIDRKSHLIKPSPILQDHSLEVTCLSAGKNNILYIGTMANGLYQYDAKTKKTCNVLSGDVKHISGIKETGNKLWVASLLDGLLLLDQHLNLSTHFTTRGDNPNSLPDNRVRVIHVDGAEKVWIGTFQGLSIYNPAASSFTNLKHDIQDPGSLSHNSVWDLIEDKQHSIWVGTYFGGVNHTNTESNTHQYYSYYNKNKGPAGYRAIGEMIEDEDKNIWIATEGGGLDYYDRRRGKITNYRKDNTSRGLSEDNIKTLYLAHKDHLYIGTHWGGFNRINTRTQQVEQFSHLPLNKNTVVSSITPYQDKLLIGSSLGLLLFDPQQETLTHFFKDPHIRNRIGTNVHCAHADGFGNVWVSTKYQGLFRYKPGTGEVKHYNEQNSRIGSNTVNLITEDRQRRLWVGTIGGGLNLYDREQDTFKNFSQEKDGLPSNFIYGLQESRFGNFWISTSQGLSRFDLENNKFYHYSNKSGFPLPELNRSSLLLTTEDELFVGGVNGLISFAEEKLFSSGKPFNIILSSIAVNNKEISPKQEGGLLTQDLPFTKQITLQPAHQVISIQYAACNYLSALRSAYEYKLEGFDKGWVDAGYKTSVSYTNLPPGTYTFKVRGLNAIYKKVVDETSLTLVVSPPVYLTWYAYIAYGTVFLALLVFFNRLYLSKIRLHDQLRLEKQKKKEVKKINKRKLTYFTNVSHEFITPLTIIIGSIETVLETARVPASVYPRLTLAHKNALRLKNLSRELLDFRKLEKGHFKIKAANQDFIPFLQEIFEDFSEAAALRNLSYSFVTEVKHCSLWFDANQMDKVFYNLLSNSFKFVADQTGKIEVVAVEHPDHLQVLIRDNGPGIPKDKADKIFDRFYQVENMSGKTCGQGTGIGLALSKGIVEHHLGTIELEREEKAGTTFRVKIRKGNTHLAAEQMLQEAAAPPAAKPNFDYPAYTAEMQTGQLKTTRVLIVDNDADARHFLAGLLPDCFEVLQAANGQQGITKALELQPDLIISDVLMPGMSGTQMCTLLKRNIQTCHIPLILLTAQTTDACKAEGLETGADDYIAKPFNTRILLIRINNILRNRLLLQESFSTTPSTKLAHIAQNKIDQDFMHRAQQYVLLNITDSELDVNTFAKEMALSRTKLYEKLKGVTGQTPNEFIQTIRLKKAAEMILQQEELNISQVAYEVGFSSSRYFSQCFKIHFGISPSKYGRVKEQV
jgi:signal transduction histidine kinase/ligand-binding sensor domain-containing protein/DNA-binding response OmpR family regulator